MSAQALLERLDRLGVELETNGDRLRYAGPNGAISSELIEDLKSYKTELLALLGEGKKDKPKGHSSSIYRATAPRWPVECLEAERRFGHPAARLYPLLDRKVETSQGPGRLWQVFSSLAGVVLESNPKRVEFVRPEEVAPYRWKTELNEE